MCGATKLVDNTASRGARRIDGRTPRLGLVAQWSLRLHRRNGVAVTGGLYEQLKDDLGYLQLGRAAETFATLAETAKRDDWSHLQFLAELVGE